MKPHDFNLRHLRAVAETAGCGSVNGAARRVGLSQPAVTQGISKIEKLTGARLFNRHSGGMAATEAGKLLAARCDGAMAALRAGFEAVRKADSAQPRGVEGLMTMAQLRALLALADAGSFVAAARASAISQPSIHRAIRDLERLCGFTLVERRGRGVVLTLCGIRLARAFRLARNELEAGLDELGAINGRNDGAIRIGSMPLARARLLPMAAARFYREYPEVTVEIVEGSHAQLIERLRDGTLDFLIGALRTPGMAADIEEFHLLEDRLMVVSGSRHPIASEKNPGLARLARFPWVMAGEGTPLRRKWEAMFAGEGMDPPPAPVICGSVMAIRTLLAEGEFLTLLSPEQVRLEIAAGVLAAIGKPIEATSRPIGVTTRRDWRPPPAQRAFLMLLKACAEEIILPENE